MNKTVTMVMMIMMMMMVMMMMMMMMMIMMMMMMMLMNCFSRMVDRHKAFSQNHPPEVFYKEKCY